jgi:hypothetical protein
VFPSIVPSVKIRIPQDEFLRGSVNDCTIPKLLSLDKLGSGSKGHEETQSEEDPMDNIAY